MSRVICEEIKCTLNIASVFFARFDSSVCGRHGGTRKPSGREYPACGPGVGDRAVIEAVAASEPVGAANGLFSIHENCLLLLVRERRTLAFSKSSDAAKQDFLLLFYHGFSLL